MIKGIIWCLNIEDGLHQLNRMIEQYEYYGHYISEKKLSKTFPIVVFGNGDMWKVRSAYESARGERCNISYIQRGISFDFIDEVIMPCMYGPFSAYRFFIGESMNEI